MARYGMDYGRDRHSGRYDFEAGYRGPYGYGGMRSDGWGADWRDFPGEGGWHGERTPGYPETGYDAGYRTAHDGWGARPHVERLRSPPARPWLRRRLRRPGPGLRRGRPRRGQGRGTRRGTRACGPPT